jgi:YggT family protein
MNDALTTVALATIGIREVVAVIVAMIGIYTAAVLVRILLTWFPATGWVEQITSVLSTFTDPYLNLFRNLIPPIGGFDLSTILAVLVLNVLHSTLSTFANGIPLPN